jgi:hypothetical protein
LAPLSCQASKCLSAFSAFGTTGHERAMPTIAKLDGAQSDVTLNKRIHESLQRPMLVMCGRACSNDDGGGQRQRPHTRDRGSISMFHYVYLFHHVYPELG